MPQIAGLLGEDEVLEMNQDTRTWAMWLHLSALLGLFTGGLGYIAPIVIWMIKKDDLPGVEPHGKAVLNALLTSLIYSLIGGVLALLLVLVTFGIAALLLIPLGLLLAGLSIAVPIIGGMKANNGILWHYPLSIRFIK